MEFLAKLTESGQVILEMLKKSLKTHQQIDQSRPLISKTYVSSVQKNALVINTTQ